MPAQSRSLRSIAVVVLAAAVGGCGASEDSPSLTPDDTHSASSSSEATSESMPTEASSSPVVEDPVPPPEISQDDTIGASAAAYYFLQLYDYSRASGDTAVWDSMSADTCEWCVSVSDAVADLHEAGGWVESSGLEFDIASSQVEFPGDGVEYYTVNLPVTEPAFTIHHGDGTTTRSDGQRLDPMAIAVQYVQGRFRIVGVNFEVSG